MILNHMSCALSVCQVLSCASEIDCIPYASQEGCEEDDVLEVRNQEGEVENRHTISP